MYHDDDFNYDDLDGSFYEAASRSTGVSEYTDPDRAHRSRQQHLCVDPDRCGYTAGQQKTAVPLGVW